MISADSCFLEMLNSPVRRLKARVELYKGGNSTLLDTFYYTDRLKSIKIERVGEENKFFGFGVCQKINIHLLDANRELNITTANTFEVVFGTDCNYIYTCPLFYVSEVHRDENTNELSITAYDALYVASQHTVNELALDNIKTLHNYAVVCAGLLGLPLNIIGADDSFNVEVVPNFEGTESIREMLNAIAEASQTIYYIDSDWRLTFKRLNRDGVPVYDITKDCYYTLKSGENRRLAEICSATELGDNVSARIEASGTTQYVRDNPFWELSDDIETIVDTAVANICGITINQFECDWRGNFLLEIGDKINLITKDDEVVVTYLLNDVITYDGSFKEKTRWQYVSNDVETDSNPTSLGDALKKTYARVDKVNKQIDLVVSETQTNKENISNLQLTTDGVSASVKRIEEYTAEQYQNLNEGINTLTSKVEAKMSADDVKLEITKELENGVGKVITSTGFKFDEDGLTVEKSDAEMKTQITEDGMKVYKDNNTVLTANNVGVNALNLHATTYLIIGNNSRIEDYGYNRTGCFFIGS